MTIFQLAIRVAIAPAMLAAALANAPLPSSSSQPPADGDAMLPATQPGEDARADDGMLRGPDVPEHVERTLVAFDAQGRLVQLDTRPEVAALALLDDLDPMQREAARAAVAERNAALSAFMLDHLDEARATADALESGKRDKANQIARELYDQFDPQQRRDPLMAALIATLTAEQAAEVQRLVDEYWTARIDRELRNAKDKTPKARAAAERRILQGGFQNELRAAYDRTLRPYRQKIDTINRIVEPNDEQRQAIREIIINFVRDTRLQPTPQQERDAARRVYDVLDEQQRIKLFEAAFARL